VLGDEALQDLLGAVAAVADLQVAAEPVTVLAVDLPGDLAGGGGQSAFVQLVEDRLLSRKRGRR
ncbi:hypothetical protein, partial [Streptomyces sp. NPDC057438]|uniref:hypothetical protein n=1 Tax=Streptomyces sp. NPDC057438 TaxID=3346133 RepID=UPI0036A28DF6